MVNMIQHLRPGAGLDGVKGVPEIKTWIIALQCVTFVVLYTVWILPDIAAWRNTSLGFGAALGIYVCYQYRDLFFVKRAASIWIIGILFLWATFHLLFLSQNFALQWVEYKSIWQRTFLAALFGLGLGLSISNNSEKCKKWAWPLIYFGLLMPTLIYIFKYILTFYGENAFGFATIPAYLKVYPSSQPFYVPKTDYVVFCLPILAVALGQMRNLIQGRQIKWLLFLLYAATIAGVSFVFHAQEIKNGVLYELLLVVLFVFLLARDALKSWSISKGFLIICFVLAMGFFVYQHIQQNKSWINFSADAKIAVQIENYPEWKFVGEKGYPENHFGKKVYGTNYERIAWALVGTRLLFENPLGYGLIEDSFGPMVNRQWPESSPRLSHAHSGWLDLALGIGLPGIILVLSALFLALKQAIGYPLPWRNLGAWILLSSLLLWFTTEVSNNGNFDPLIFWIAMTAALGLGFEQSRRDESLPLVKKS